jgi:hypothetical protein
MVVKCVLFSGKLDDSNNLKVTVDEAHCPLRFGNWLMRIDTLTVTVPKQGQSFHLSVACSLMQSAQHVNVEQERGVVKKIKQMRATPMYVLCVTQAARADDKKALLFARNSVWHGFTNGTPEFYLQFRDLDDVKNNEMKLSVHGIIHFQCVTAAEAAAANQ